VAGLAMCFYLPYGTWAISHALSLANGGSGRVTPVMMIGALCVTGVIIGFDALIISHVAVNTADLDDSEAPPTGTLSRAMIALRLVIAIIMVGVFTIPTLLFFFQRETTADLAGQNQQAIANYVAHGPPVEMQAQINKLTAQETSDPGSVLALENKASALDTASSSDYQLALKDSQGQGLTHQAGCPYGGDCWALQQKSAQESSEASALRKQAQTLQGSQKAQLASDAAEINTLTARRNADLQSFTQAQTANTGLGARTKSLASLAAHDPFGIGLAAAIVLAVATLLELAVLGIKITASRNSEYELAVAREARRALKAQSELDSATDEVAREAIAEVRIDPGLREAAFERRRRQMQAMLAARLGPIPDVGVVDSFPVRPAAPPSKPAESEAGRTTGPTRLDGVTEGQSTFGARTETSRMTESSSLSGRPRTRVATTARGRMEVPALVTARMPGVSNAGRVTALAVVAGLALVLVLWGVG
jgi:hypothetical protein